MLFQTKNNVPYIYMKSSRDFQLLAAILDIIYNYTISNQLKINYLDDLEIVDSKLLTSISKYLGFFTNQYYPEDLLRSILINFPAIIRNKGCFLGIQLAIKALQNAYTDISFVNIHPELDEQGNQIQASYVIETDGVLINQSYIDEVLSYVLPVGAIIKQVQIIQDINDLKPEIYKNEDKLLNLFFDKSSDNNSYIVDEGDLYVGLIRKSYIISDSANDNTNMYFSKVGQTPIVKSAIKGVINIKSTI